MDQRSEYLTEKVRFGYSGKDIMRMVLLGVLGVLLVESVFSTIESFTITEVLASVIILVPSFLCFWKGTLGPVFRNRDSSAASRIAEQLRLSSNPKVPIASLEKALGMTKLDRKVQRIIRKRYLKNLVYDEGKREIQLSVVSEHMKEDWYQRVYCPNCGAENMVRIGWIAKCQYCGTLLPDRNEQKED